ncbi:cytochrome P450 4C1-like isoform X2 [Sitophilus oryzae]|uniref:Cytochrome P450 4C1-like isoform X2 n=1 Tax=Sitophilus oryzae TaxID=7048 RepID=A0A6J2XVW7_SITOR|nr:cytochrome P450 4C1-like isoform X2 [Sitophilus oryzae]
MRMVFKNSLLFQPVNIWKGRRKFISKSFSQPILNSFVQYFNENSNVLVKVLRNFNHDLYSVFGRYTFDTFTEAIVGRNYHLQTDLNNKLLEEMDVIQHFLGCEYFVRGCCFGVLMRIKDFLCHGWHALWVILKFRRFLADKVRCRMAEFDKCPDSQLSFVDAMLNRKDIFPRKIIETEFILFASAATDTTGNSLVFIFTLLGMYPEIQEKVFEEIVTNIGRDEPIEVDHLTKLKYTERVIFECMRLLPSVTEVSRYISKDIKIGDKTFPKGTNISIYILGVHRNSKYWPNPDKFDPDRFLPEEIAKRPPYAYILFSAGPRNCIGKMFATMSIKVVVANVIRNFRVSSKYRSIDEMEMRCYMTMRTKHDIDCHFTPRD